MRRLCVFAVAAACVLGCGKKPADEPKGEAEKAPPDDPQSVARAQLRGGLVTAKGDARAAAIDAAAARAAGDPGMVEVLVELLKDKANAGAGKTHPNQATSNREAAALALQKAGPPGVAALTAKGFPILAGGLADPDAAVREHTAHTLGRLGPLAKPLSPAVQKLVADPDPKVREAAADAVREIGITDPAGLAALMTNPDVTVRRAAARLLGALEEIPPAAVGPLTAALADDDATVRVAAASAISLAGPAAGADAAAKLAAAIEKTYPAEYDPAEGWIEGAELAYWEALVQIGEPAAAALAGLLGHSNTLVRYLAASALAEIGEPAAAAAAALRNHMLDEKEDGSVRVEAACALCRIGRHVPEAVKLVEAALDGRGARYAVAAVPRMGPAGAKLVPAALAKLADDDPYARLAAVRMAGRLDPETAAKAVPALAKLVDDDQPVIRRQMALVLAKLGPAAAPAAAALGRVLLGETDGAVQEEYVGALIAMGPGAKPAAAVLVRMFDNTDVPLNLRLQALVAAAAADPANPTVVSVVVKAASDKDEYARAAAAAALGKLDPLTPEAVAALVKLAKTDSRHVARAAAVRALAEAGPRAKSARPDLDALATTGAPGVRLWAKVAVAAVDGNVQAAAPAVRAGLADPDAQVRQAAAEALAVLGPTPADVPPLVTMLRDANGREAAIRALGRVGPAAREAVPRLADLLDDRDSRVRLAAAEALGQIGPPAALAAVPKLREAARDPLVAAAARRSLEKLGVKETAGKK